MKTIFFEISSHFLATSYNLYRKYGDTLEIIVGIGDL
jgi:hypothetical protein